MTRTGRRDSYDFYKYDFYVIDEGERDQRTKRDKPSEQRCLCDQMSDLQFASHCPMKDKASKETIDNDKDKRETIN